MLSTALLLSLLLLVGGVALSSAQDTGVLGQSSVDEIVRSLGSPVIPSSRSSGAEPAFLRNADAQRRNNPSTQGVRSQFSTSSGPDQFFSSDTASSAADGGVQQTQQLVKKTRSRPQAMFNANGGSDSPEIAEVNARLVTSCVYDKANNLPCNSEYREPTGRCTSIVDGRKTWGMAGTPFTRVLSPKYEDGLGARRVNEFTSGRRLQSPRKISTTVSTTDVILNFEGVTSHVMQWGQFIAHEFTQLAESDRDAACCPDEIFQATYGRSGSHSELDEIRQALETFRGDICQQIELKNDPVYNRDICIRHVRSRPTPQHNCALGPRQQSNSVTHVFDASNVYGSSQAEQNKLRDSRGGRMKTQTVNGAILPPQNTEGCPAAQRQASRCPFAGGDNRINTTPNLISAHTAFIIKHNQIADTLAGINRHWGHEKLFQETRRIISAIQSNIHFYEYLPIILGNSVRAKFGLTSYNGFDDNVNPSILNELAGAAFRFGHSLINGMFHLDKDDGRDDFVDLRPSFFDSDVIYNDGTKQCVKGLSKDRPWRVDKNFPTEMRDFLFNENLDIVAFNLNRGRDHGFNSYADYRSHYGLRVPRSFDDLINTHPRQVVDQLRSVYTNVEDVELYIAGVTELPVAGGLVGELFANIMADGFSRSRKGDRFFFESSQSGLNQAQINAIRGYTYAQLNCEAHGLDTIINKIFFRVGSKGARTVSCSSFTPLNLDLWREGTGVPAQQCHWKTIRTSPCCNGRRIITRNCIGKSSSCRCSGSRKITQSCNCRDHSDCPSDYFMCFRRGGVTPRITTPRTPDRFTIHPRPFTTRAPPRPTPIRRFTTRAPFRPRPRPRPTPFRRFSTRAPPSHRFTARIPSHRFTPRIPSQRPTVRSPFGIRRPGYL